MTQIAKDVEGKDRNELLQPKQKISNANQRIPLVINWHQKVITMRIIVIIIIIIIIIIITTIIMIIKVMIIIILKRLKSTKC